LAEEGEEKGSVMVTWNPPLPTKHPVAGYEVQIRELVDGSKTEWMRFGFTYSLDGARTRTPHLYLPKRVQSLKTSNTVYATHF
jgi:hypothetical protein